MNINMKMRQMYPSGHFGAELFYREGSGTYPRWEAKLMTSSEQYQVALFRELVPALMADNAAAAAARASGRPRGPVTKLVKLDEALGGFLAPGVHILQSGPGAGKTALALQIVANCGFPALYVTAEMPALELFRRLIARATGTFLGRLKSGELAEADLNRLAQRTLEQVPWLAWLDATAGYVSPATILELASALGERAGAAQVLVVLDSLQYWARGGGELSEYERVSAGVAALAEIAAQLASPVIAIAHRNRAGQEKGGLHAAKGSGDLEYVSETVLELLREKETKPDASGKVAVTLAIHKNRHGEAGKLLPLEFSGRVQQFVEK